LWRPPGAGAPWGVTSRQKGALVRSAIGLGVMAAAAVLAGGWRRPPRRRRRRRRLERAIRLPNPWVTLSNKRRVEIDDDGRVLKGLPAEWRGIHVQDVSEVSRRTRELEEASADCEQEARGRRRPTTFRTADQAVAALLAANPKLLDFYESECGQRCEDFRQWVRGGRRGRKPHLDTSDGRLDSFNETLELRGRHKVTNWLEALYRVVPASRRWEDFRDRLPLLEEATGLRVELPEEAEELARLEAYAAECREGGDARIDDLLRVARETRLGRGAPVTMGEDQDEVPF